MEVAQASRNLIAWATLLALINANELCHAQTKPAPAARRHPNVLFIAVDDLRPELGCYGVDGVQSPNIDRLQKTGLAFERAYCQMAVCNPSRVSLLTGLRPDSTRVWDLATEFRTTIPDAVTLPRHFRTHGYHAVSYGKIFHNPWPDNPSWDEPHQWPEGDTTWSAKAKKNLHAFRDQMRRDGANERAINRMRAVATEIVDVSDNEMTDGAIADQGIGAMRRLAKKDQPFFLAVGFLRPHLPFVVPRTYWEMYDRAKIPLAEHRSIPRGSPSFAMNTMYELRDYMDYFGTTDPRQGPLTEAQQRELKHGYYASVTFVDAQVGRVLDELDRLDLANDTIVVLWGDHGWKLGDHNSWCKQTNYEVDTRAPLIIRDPRIRQANHSSKALVEFVDVYPTLCDLAGIPKAEHLQGASLAPLMRGEQDTIKTAAFSQFPRRTGTQELMGYAMRTDRHRYVEWIDRMTVQVVAQELYDHAHDPGETVNLAADPNAADQLAALSKQLWSTLSKPAPISK